MGSYPQKCSYEEEKIMKDRSRRIATRKGKGRKLSPEEKVEVFAMRANGASYKEISQKFLMSCGSISYYFGKNQKEKTTFRNNKMRHGPGGRLRRKIEQFNVKYSPPRERPRSKRRRCFYIKFRKFKGEDNMIAFKEVLEKIWSGEDNDKRTNYWTKCSLTGADINMDAYSDEPDVGSLDHERPRSRGGENTIENCQPLRARTNQMKGDMTNEEFKEEIRFHYEKMFLN
jgi:5-methylcytosine-specific restriction endonuclease McrA